MLKKQGGGLISVIDDGGRILPVPAVFGFPGTRDGKLLINARSETAARKPAFAESLRKRRIVLPANGFSEWDHSAKNTKYYFTADALDTIYLCGLYRIVEGRYRFVILTRAANESMLAIHDVESADPDEARLSAPAPALTRQPA